MNPEPLSQGKILVVEDTPNTVQMISDILSAAGYQVFVAMTGEKALDRADKILPDVILLDILLPEMDGYEICRRLKSRESTAALPVIFLSALTETFDKIKGFELGAVDYLAKPIAAEELLARVRTHVTIHRLRRDLEEANHLLEARVAARTAELSALNRALAHEIAERTRAEQEVRQLNVELEARVIQRTEELQTANEELQSFAYVVSHDLKEPLRGIQQLSQWLKQDYGETIDEKGKEMFTLLTNQVKRLDNLIDGVLQYSRAGRKMRIEAPVHLSLLLADIIESLAPPETIRITIAPDLPEIIADPIRIRQVFQNLIGNAIKFLDKPRGKILIRCEDEFVYWKFSVTDNGPGIDVQHYERIFRIFQTLGSHEHLENTGIGLSIVKKIVEFYGGKIWVESEVGTGSTFYFTFPKRIAVEEQA